jgi:uncharacterized protein (TIGR02270 family)
MSNPPRQRPIGFAPREISALVLEDVVRQHAEEAAFLWTQRRRAVHEPHYALKDLAVLDERVEAHIDGLRVAGDIGWRRCKANLENLGPGEVFAVGVLAFGAGERERMTEALQAGCACPRTTPGLVSALGWLEFDAVSRWVDRMLEAKSPAHRAVGIRACAIHRRDPGSVLASATKDPDPACRGSALRAVGELKRHDLNDDLRLHVRSRDDMCRFWAAWSLALNGAHDGVVHLIRFFDRSDSFGVRALHVGLRAMPFDESRAWVSTLARKPELSRHAVIGAGIVGDPASIPWLIRKMAVPELARLAGEAFTMISGLDLSYHDLDEDAPQPTDTDDASIETVLDLDYESNLPWPSAALVARWWERNESAFTPGVRYLAGKPITAQTAVEVLTSGKQRLRSAAALELALLNPTQMMFEVRKRTHWQLKELSAWTW